MRIERLRVSEEMAAAEGMPDTVRLSGIRQLCKEYEELLAQYKSNLPILQRHIAEVDAVLRLADQDVTKAQCQATSACRVPLLMLGPLAGIRCSGSSFPAPE